MASHRAMANLRKVYRLIEKASKRADYSVPPMKLLYDQVVDEFKHLVDDCVFFEINVTPYWGETHRDHGLVPRAMYEKLERHADKELRFGAIAGKYSDESMPYCELKKNGELNVYTDLQDICMMIYLTGATRLPRCLQTVLTDAADDCPYFTYNSDALTTDEDDSTDEDDADEKNEVEPACAAVTSIDGGDAEVPGNTL